MAVIPRRKIKGKNGGILTPFNKGESGNPAGGQKSQLTLLREGLQISYDWKISKNDAEQLLRLLAFAPISELHKLYANPHLPAVVANFIKALLKDIKDGKINAAKDIIEFNFGKAVQKVEVEDKREAPTSLSQFSADDIVTSFKYGLPILGVEDLEKVSEMVENELQKKRSNDAKIINQTN